MKDEGFLSAERPSVNVSRRTFRNITVIIVIMLLFVLQFEQVFPTDVNCILHKFIYVFVNWRSCNTSNMEKTTRGNGTGSRSCAIPGLGIGYVEKLSPLLIASGCLTDLSPSCSLVLKDRRLSKACDEKF